MRKITLALLAATCLVTPVLAGETLLNAPEPADRYFTEGQRLHAFDIHDVDGRYPRPASYATRIEFPDMTGAPIPIDPVGMVGPYADGEAAVPIEGFGRADVKGDARGDRRLGGSRAYHGAGSRSAVAW